MFHFFECKQIEIVVTCIQIFQLSVPLTPQHSNCKRNINSTACFCETQSRKFFWDGKLPPNKIPLRTFGAAVNKLRWPTLLWRLSHAVVTPGISSRPYSSRSDVPIFTSSGIWCSSWNQSAHLFMSMTICLLKVCFKNLNFVFVLTCRLLPLEFQ